MRMHRGSSNGSAGPPRDPETLPLSAPPLVCVSLHIERARSVEVRTIRVPPGRTLREILRTVGMAAEGSAVLDEGRSVPLDTRVDRDCEFTVVPTFSGG